MLQAEVQTYGCGRLEYEATIILTKWLHVLVRLSDGYRVRWGLKRLIVGFRASCVASVSRYRHSRSKVNR